MIYAGIGSRSTPLNILEIMKEFARLSAEAGHILRSGGAEGADSAFEEGCDTAHGQKEIFVPWKGFNKNPSTLFPPSPEAHVIAATIHKAYKFLKPPARLLIARNMHQILGADLKTPVRCVVCWTEDGCESADKYTSKTGGTGSAIALASQNEIPVFNLKNKWSFNAAMDLLLPIHHSFPTCSVLSNIIV